MKTWVPYSGDDTTGTRQKWRPHKSYRVEFVAFSITLNF